MSTRLFEEAGSREYPQLQKDHLRKRVLEKLKRYGNKIMVKAESDKEPEIVERYEMLKAYDNFVLMRSERLGYRECFLYVDLYQKLVG